MFRTNRIAAIVLGGALAALPALSQESGRSEATVQAFGSFVKTTTQDGIQQGATNSGGVLGSLSFLLFEQQWRRSELRLFTQHADLWIAGRTSGSIGQTSMKQLAAYVYRHALRGFTPFVEGGVGGLVFNPTDAPGASTQARAAFVYGGGADFNLTKRIFLRAEYRGLVYNSPTFDLAPALSGHRSCHALRAEPFGEVLATKF